MKHTISVLILKIASNVKRIFTNILIAGVFKMVIEKTYWNGHGKHEHMVSQLQKLVPNMGNVANPEQNEWLETFRKASSAYYDLYNNGLCNRAKEFRAVFGFGGVIIARTNYTNNELIEKLESKMDDIIVLAYNEQFKKVEVSNG